MMTTIRLSKETKKLMDNYGRKGETYEDIILRCLIESKGGKIQDGKN